MTKSSIGSWAFIFETNNDSFERVAEQLKALKFDAVDLGSFAGHPNPGMPEGHKPKADEDPENWPGQILDPSAQTEYAAKFRETYGLEIPVLAADLWDQELLTNPDPAQYLRVFQTNSDFAKNMGIKTIRVDTTQGPQYVKEVGYDEVVKRVIAGFKAASRIAADNGQDVTWEFEPGFALTKADDIQRVFEGVNEPNFGIQYDTSHGECVAVEGHRQVDQSGEYIPVGQRKTYESQVEFLEDLASRGIHINTVHLIDSDGTLHHDETSRHVVMGEGRLNFNEIMPAIKKTARPNADYLTIDLCFEPDAMSKTAKCKLALNDIIATYGSMPYSGPGPRGN